MTGADAAAFERALALHKAGRTDDAAKLCRDVLAKSPAHPGALNLAATIATRQGKFAEAVALYERLAKTGAIDVATLCNFGATLSAAKRPAEALVQFDRALKRDADFLPAHYNRAVVLQGLGQHAEAVSAYDRVLARTPDNATAHNNRGVALHALGHNVEAVAAYDRALALKPGYADAFDNRGHALRDLGRHEDALASYDAAARLRPDFAAAQFHSALTRLLLGQFTEGWRQFESRAQADPLHNPHRTLSQPVWRGDAPLRGRTILLHAEQGLGDTIHMVRYAPLVARQGATVLLEVQPGLVPLLKQMEGEGITLIPRGAALPAIDFHASLMSLPLAFKTELATIPASPAYLAADPVLTASWRARLSDTAGLRIGLAWSGSSIHPDDRIRSIPLAQLVPLVMRHPDCTFFVLQKDLTDSDCRLLKAHPAIRVVEADFAETAALIANLDLVVTVDTVFAHLAGALGKPAWVMLSFVPDWRWLLDRSDSPWYPSVRLFRQKTLGVWDSVVADLGDALDRLASASSWPR